MVVFKVLVVVFITTVSSSVAVEVTNNLNINLANPITTSSRTKSTVTVYSKFLTFLGNTHSPLPIKSSEKVSSSQISTFTSVSLELLYVKLTSFHFGFLPALFYGSVFLVTSPTLTTKYGSALPK